MNKMTPLVDTEIIKQTPLANDVAVMTVRRSGYPYFLRLFATLVVSGSTRYVQRLTDHTCEAAALHRHDALARDLRAWEIR